MTGIGILQILVFFGLILLVTKPVGLFMSRLFQGERTFLHPVMRPIESARLQAVRRSRGRRNSAGRNTPRRCCRSASSRFLFVYAIQRLQGHLPLNPQGFGTAQVPPDLAFNTAVSFTTNTNWQAYSGESTLSYLVQMAALAVQNFASAAAGIAVAIALIRGFARQRDRPDRQLLGRSDTRDALRSAADLLRRGPRLLLAGRHPELPSVYRRQDGRGRDADHRARARRFAGSHQDARHQRRRVLQRQLGAPVRESDAVHESRADPPDLRAGRRAHLHVRTNGQGHPAGLGVVCRHGA